MSVSIVKVIWEIKFVLKRKSVGFFVVFLILCCIIIIVDHIFFLIIDDDIDLKRRVDVFIFGYVLIVWLIFCFILDGENRIFLDNEEKNRSEALKGQLIGFSELIGIEFDEIILEILFNAQLDSIMDFGIV